MQPIRYKYIPGPNVRARFRVPCSDAESCTVIERLSHHPGELLRDGTVTTGFTDSHQLRENPWIDILGRSRFEIQLSGVELAEFAQHTLSFD